MLEWFQYESGCSMFCCFRVMTCTWAFFSLILAHMTMTMCTPTPLFGGTRWQNVLHDPKEGTITESDNSFLCMPCTANEIFTWSPFLFLSLPVLFRLVPSCLRSLFFLLQSMRTLALQWVCPVPDHAPENNLLLPHLPHQHPHLHHHLPHGPLPHRAWRWHPDCYHSWQRGRLLQNWADAHWWCDVSGKAHQQARGLWAVSGTEAAPLWHNHYIPG